ncbi:LysR family transcriptional regulator [Beggiatoa alba]|nr:LysR family transcriptional regulator [Beggiatoa alba]
MKLTLDALNVLDAINRRGSFAAAAEELFRVPSAVSYTMQKLEQDLDTPLFDRAGHRAVLTPAGRTLLDEGRRLLIAAHELECQVKRIATGWETSLRIAADTLIPVSTLLPLVQDFFLQQSAATSNTSTASADKTDATNSSARGTQIQLLQEVLGGSWDALVSGRADLVIGASGEGPAGGGFSSLPLGDVDMVFAVASNHPLAQAAEPVSSSEIMKYRAVAVADSSRDLAPRSVGLLTGQQILTVPDMQSKLEAQIQGLGVGYLPRHWINTALAKQQLVIKSVQGVLNSPRLYVVWRSDNSGKALQWFVRKLKDDRSIQDQLLQSR